MGSYRLVERLGTGGMGTVYLAEDGADRVALKVLHPHLLQRRGFFERFLREADAGARVDHENVVRTLGSDLLVVDEEPYHFLVMEYVEGRTLRELVRELSVVPEAFLREIGRQVAAGLAAIHAEGIVHRDLKPENVLITEDKRVRIMDLGVARFAEATGEITREGDFTGSLLYASPEQLRREEAGPAADLYSLGLLLFELGTGRHPFRRDGTVELISAHLAEKVPEASRWNPDLSPFLSEVVATLLAKDPRDRFPSAEALHAALEEGEQSSWWAERERELARVALPRIQVRRETELCGRETELGLLEKAWEEARRGEGRSLLLEGEAGIGKTRLVDAFLESLREEEAHVLYGSYPPAGGLGGLSDAGLGKFGSAGLAESLAPYLAVTPSLVPGFAALVRHERPLENAPPLRGDALDAVFCHLVRALAAERPTVWVVEDLHFAGEDSKRTVLSLARALEGNRVLLLLTTRPRIPEDDLAHLGRLETHRRVALGRLGAREVIRLLRDAFRSEALADKLGAKIAYKSDGVPFFVFEMIRGLKEGQFITELPDGTYVETREVERIEVPSAVRDLIEARLRGLADGERSLLDLAAVQGFEFDPDLLA
ncbi:MAG: serine/threonine-protein kinase, partial [Planctomycetota bacterium]